MAKRSNRVTVDLPDALLAYVDSVLEQRGLDPRKRSTVLIEALSDRYNRERMVFVEGRAFIKTAENPDVFSDRESLIEGLSNEVVAKALEKIELRIKKG